MKTLYLMIAFSLFGYMNAQLTVSPIPMPAGYGFLHSAGNFYDSDGEPLFVNNDNIYGYTERKTSGKGYLFKYSFSNNTVTILESKIFDASSFKSLNHFYEKNGDVYFLYSDGIYKIDKNTDNISKVLDSNIYSSYEIIGDLIYTFGGNSWLYNITTKSSYEPTQSIYINNIEYKQKIKFDCITEPIDNEAFALGEYNHPISGQKERAIYKLSTSGFSKYVDLPPIDLYFLTINDDYKLTFINNKIIFGDYQGVSTSKLYTFDINTKQLSVLSQIPYSGNAIVFNNKLFFITTTNQVYETDGVSVATSNIKNPFYGGYYYLRNFIYVFNNRYFFDDAQGTWISNGNLADTINLSPYEFRKPVTIDDKVFFLSSNLGLLQIYDDNTKKITGGYLSSNNYGMANGDSFLLRQGNALYTNVYYKSTNTYRFSKIDISNILSSTEFKKNSLIVYPNPATTILNFSQSLSNLQILDMSGKQAISQKETAKSISVEKLPKGNYLLTAKDKDGKSISHKFIKE